MSRILHLRSGSGLYGAERALLALATRTRAPFTAEVGSICRTVRSDALSREARRQGLTSTSLVSRTATDFEAVGALVRLIRARRIALLHAHDYKSLAFATLASARSGCPVVATYHGDTRITLRVRGWEALARGLGNLTRGVAAVSRPLAAELGRWVRFAPVRHVPNGIAIPPRVDPDERATARAHLGLDGPTVAVIGRLSPEKGHPVLLDALERMRSRPALLVAGDGPLKQLWESAAAQHRIRLLGPVDDVRPIYAASDMVVLPSRTEGLPLVALEAMASGIPLVASAVGALPELCAGGAGVLVPPDDPATLATALDEVLASPELRSAIADRARRHVVSEHGADAMAARYAEELYAPALEGGFAKQVFGVR